MESIRNALFTTTQRKVLGLLFGAPQRSFYTREIIRLTGMGVATIKRELDRLSAAGILTLTRVGNQHHYQANPDCPVYPELVSMVNKIIGDDLLQGALAVPTSALSNLARRYCIKRLSLFGSAARGELKDDSDIDLLVEFEAGKAPSLGDMVRISEDLSALFGGRKVDIATPSILNNPYRKRAIEKDMELLYAA